MAEKKKPKPGPSTGGSSKSRIKRPKGSQPLTLGTGGLRTGKVSKKQQAGTRKVVGAIASVTPVGRVAKAATKGADKLIGKAITKSTNKKWTQLDIPKPTTKISATKQSIRERKLTKERVPPISSRTWQPSWTANDGGAVKSIRSTNALKKRVKAAGKLNPVPKKVSRDFNKTLSELQAGKTPSYKPSTAKKPTRTKPNPYNKAKDEVLSLDSVVRSNRRGSAGRLDKRFQILSTPTKKKNIRAYKASQKKK
jgi:hypothetical protein